MTSHTYVVVAEQMTQKMNITEMQPHTTPAIGGPTSITVGLFIRYFPYVSLFHNIQGTNKKREKIAPTCFFYPSCALLQLHGSTQKKSTQQGHASSPFRLPPDDKNRLPRPTFSLRYHGSCAVHASPACCLNRNHQLKVVSSSCPSQVRLESAKLSMYAALALRIAFAWGDTNTFPSHSRSRAACHRPSFSDARYRKRFVRPARATSGPSRNCKVVRGKKSTPRPWANDRTVTRWLERWSISGGDGGGDCSGGGGDDATSMGSARGSRSRSFIACLSVCVPALVVVGSSIKGAKQGHC